MASRTVARAGAAAGAAAAVSVEVANCDAAPGGWELVAPTEIDETVAMISPGHSAGSLLALGRELARDPRVQEVVGERIGLRGGPASLLAPPSDEAGEEVLRRVRAELERLREELGEQQELNGELLSQNDQLRRENVDLKEQAALPAELEGLEFPRELFASLTLEEATASSVPDELDYVPGPTRPADDDGGLDDGADDEADSGFFEAALGVAAMIVLFCVLRKTAPEQAQRAGKVCASVLAAAASFFKTQQRKH